jgi:hypothetical protein
MPEPTVQRSEAVLAPFHGVKVRMKEDVPMRLGCADPPAWPVRIGLHSRALKRFSPTRSARGTLVKSTARTFQP